MFCIDILYRWHIVCFAIYRVLISFWGRGSTVLKGVVLSVLSSCIFAGLYYYSTLLSPLDGQEIFGWRILSTLPCLTLLILVNRQWGLVMQIVRQIQQKPAFCIILLLSSFLLGMQQWLFMWAPLNGKALDVSLGYFLLPLSMLVVGKCIYRERLTILQKVAALTAAIGVANEAYHVGGFSKEALLVAIGFPLYFILRRYCKTHHLGGLWFDVLLMLPVACWFVAENAVTQFVQAPKLYYLILGLAILSATGFSSYIAASRLLSFSIFGLLGYVEPVLLVIVAWMLGEHIADNQWLTYVPIWCAVALLVVDGVRKAYRTAQ